MILPPILFILELGGKEVAFFLNSVMRKERKEREAHEPEPPFPLHESQFNTSPLPYSERINEIAALKAEPLLNPFPD